MIPPLFFPFVDLQAVLPGAKILPHFISIAMLCVRLIALFGLFYYLIRALIHRIHPSVPPAPS